MLLSDDFYKSILWRIKIVLYIFCSLQWLLPQVFYNIEVFASSEPHYFVMRTPACGVLVFYLSYLDWCVSFLHCLHYFIIGISDKEILKGACFFCKDYSIIYWYKNGNISFRRYLKVLFAICWRYVYKTSACGCINKVVTDHEVD